MCDCNTDIWFTAVHCGDIDTVEQYIHVNPSIVNTDNVYYNISLHVAARGGSVEITKMLLKAGANVNAMNISLETPLHYAARSGHAKIAELLIDAGANVNARSVIMNTPLHLSARAESVEIVAMLLANGADVDTTNKYLDTPLCSALVYRSGQKIIDIVKLLLKYDSPMTSLDDDDISALEDMKNNSDDQIRKISEKYIDD